jgi:type II secretory pathway component HofQ
MTIVTLFLTAAVLLQQPVSLDVRDAELRDFFAMMGNLGNLNVIVHPAVEGRVSLNVHDVPWGVLLDAVLKNHSLGREIQDNALRIAPLSAMEADYRQRAAVEEARLKAMPLKTRTIVLRYRKAEDVAVIAAQSLSPRGSLAVDRQRNAIIVRDVVR